jgi:hypothetical protein
MKFTLVVLATGALAQLQQPSRVTRSDATLSERDVATISQVITDVGTGITSLDTAVKAFSASDSASLTTLNSAASMIVQTLKDGTSKIQATANISLNDAITLQSQTTGLQSTGQSLVSDLTSKKSEVEKAGLCEIVRQQVTGVSDNTKSLIDAIVSKIPEAAQAIAGQQTAGFTTALQSIQGVYAEGNCTNQGTTAAGVSASNATTTRGTATATSKPATFTGAAAMMTAAAAPVGAFAIAVAAALL